MTKTLNSLIAASLLIVSLGAHSQCAPGIPGAGNPGCIPPSQPNSPYYQADSGAPITPPPTSKWESRWGAVAIDSDAGTPGAIVGRTSKSDAERVAMDICQHNGGSKCKVLISFYNQCAAVSQSPKGGSLFARSAFPQQPAEERALKQCGDSTPQVLFSECSMPAQDD